MVLKRFQRLAMTLVELMVVMAIIIMFAAITAAFYPANQADRELSRFTSTVQSALLSARNKAKAERLPTGIRFFADPLKPSIVGDVTFVQKPAPLEGFSFGAANIAEIPLNSRNYYVNFGNPANPNALKSPLNESLLSGGEYIVLNTGEVSKFTNAIDYVNNRLLLDSSNLNYGFLLKLSSNPSSYKILRNPEILPGDKPFEISNSLELLMPNISPVLTTVPTPLGYILPVVPGNYFDILFSPDGFLAGSHSSDIYLHFHNPEGNLGTGPSFSNADFSRDALLAVRRLSGAIGVFDVGREIDFQNINDPTKHNPYLIAKDPNNKGI